MEYGVEGVGGFDCNVWDWSDECGAGSWCVMWVCGMRVVVYVCGIVWCSEVWFSVK